jgi:ATP-dependent DNA helicase RecQ
MIFSDRALVEMAASYPHDESQFLAINGVGEVKLARYGAAFLEVIRNYCREHGKTAVPQQEDNTQESATSWLTVKRRFQAIGEEFAKGKSLGQIAEQFVVKERTVVRNLYRYREQGGELSAERVLACSKLSASDRARVLALFEQVGTERLAPVWQALDGAMSYEELDLLRLYWTLVQQGAAGK